MYEVRDSPIHGKGLFATQLIEAGTLIGTLQGKLTRKNGPYVLWLSETQGMLVTCDLRYINHDAVPNAAYCDDGTVMALSDIQPGDEITHDYTGEGEVWEEQEDEGPTAEVATGQGEEPAVVLA